MLWLLEQISIKISTNIIIVIVNKYTIKQERSLTKIDSMVICQFKNNTIGKLAVLVMFTITLIER